MAANEPLLFFLLMEIKFSQVTKSTYIVSFKTCHEL